MFWTNLVNLFRFTGITDQTVWQDVAISAVAIPLAIAFWSYVRDQLDKYRPAKALLKGFLDKDKSILVFHSQMSGADNNYNHNPNQKYITIYPDPLPTDSNHKAIQKKFNIDPILSRAEAHVIGDVFGVLGQCGKITNILVADLISDWGKWTLPTITVGFNPKTHKLLQGCDPIYFTLGQNSSGGMEIKDINSQVSYDSWLPNDAGVIQKTFLKESKTPVYIMAGIGTAGTEATGYILSKHLSDLGKLYGSTPFCAFIKVNPEF